MLKKLQSKCCVVTGICFQGLYWAERGRGAAEAQLTVCG